MKRSTTNSIAFYLILALSLWGCKKTSHPHHDENLVACGTKNPIENLSWLKPYYEDMANHGNVNAIVLYEYNGKEVIEVQNGYYSSTNNHQYFCDGVKLDFEGGTYNFNDYKAKRREVSVLFGTKIWN